jgi:hypothetical protein
LEPTDLATEVGFERFGCVELEMIGNASGYSEPGLSYLFRLQKKKIMTIVRNIIPPMIPPMITPIDVFDKCRGSPVL